MKIKICGIRRSEDVSYVNLLLPDWCGFILAPEFRRTVLQEDAKFFAAKTDKRVKKVGVFVNQPPKQVAAVANYTGIDIIQLHGKESNDYIDELRKLTNLEIWKAFRVKSVDEIQKAADSKADMILLDSFVPNMIGGTGKKLNTDIIKQANIKRPFIAAGGINADNMNEIINEIHPFAVDVSGGAETDGVKDVHKMTDLIKIAKGVE